MQACQSISGSALKSVRRTRSGVHGTSRTRGTSILTQQCDAVPCHMLCADCRDNWPATTPFGSWAHGVAHTMRGRAPPRLSAPSVLPGLPPRCLTDHSSAVLSGAACCLRPRACCRPALCACRAWSFSCGRLWRAVLPPAVAAPAVAAGRRGAAARPSWRAALQWWRSWSRGASSSRWPMCPHVHASSAAQSAAPLPEAARPCRHSLRTCARHSLLRSRPHNIKHSRARQCNLTVLYHGMSGSHTWSRHRCCANIISWQLPHGDAAHGGAVAAPQPDRQAVQLVDARAALPQLESLHCDDTLQAHRRTHTSITGASDKFSTRLQRACACTQDLAAGTRVQAPGPAGSRAAPPEPRVLQPSGGRC